MSETRGFRCDWCAAEKVIDQVPSGWLTRLEDDPIGGRVTLHFCRSQCSVKWDERRPAVEDEAVGF